METYLLKSGACLALFFLFYKLFLEKETMHVFKRFYLLVSLILSLVIPLITFTYYVEPILESATVIVNNDALPALMTQEAHQIINWSLVLLTIYGLGDLVFGIKFILNLSKLFYKINVNPKHKNKPFINVLLKDLVIPHTFFNYIFLNKLKFEKRDIPKEVLLHEQTHAKQKHSLDILLIEVFQIVFWYNPLIYFIKHSIKLNHEFLADQAVLNQGINTSQYQQILLAFSSNAMQPQLANAINYSLIKKRFTIMKTQTSKKTIWLRSLIVLPLLAILIFSFSTKEEVLINQDGTEHFENDLNEVVSYTTQNTDKDKYYEHATFRLSRENSANVITKTYSELTESEKKMLVPAPKTPLKKSPSQKQMNDWKDGGTYGIWVDSKRINNTSLSNYKNSDFDLFYVSKLAKNATNYGKHFYQVNLYSKNKFKELYSIDIKPLSKGTVIHLVNNSSVKDQQQSATREQMAEYNKLAVHYNTALKNKKDVIIKLKHVERLKYIYGLMSDKQRKDAEPFPDFPKPPPPPAANAPKVLKEEMILPPPPPIPDDATPAQRAKYKKTIAYHKKKNMTPPPPPPPPSPNPVKHMKEMLEKGAIFYYEDKEISGKEAIKIAQENEGINIQIKDHDTDEPTVKLSTKPIQLKTKH